MKKANLAGTSRLKIFVGEFGSGKTELAVNYAIGLKEQGYTTAIVDIDLVKPYFRTRENRKMLEERGIVVAASEKNLSHAGLPVLPQDLSRVLYDHQYQVVMDVGGGESAIVLGQLHQQLQDNIYDAMLVVNIRRPFTSNKEAIIDAIRRIEQAGRITISGLVSNTNLAEETTEEHVREGLAVAEEVALERGLPIKWVVVPEWLSSDQYHYPVFVLKRYIRYPWME